MGFFNVGFELTSYDVLTLPHSRLRSKKKDEYSSACPMCGGYDRFRYWRSVGNVWCRKCEFRGCVVDAPRVSRVDLFRDIVSSKITSKTPEFYRWKVYNTELYDNLQGQEYWMNALGANYVKAIEEFKLGWTDFPDLGPSAVIPIEFGNKVIFVKHRLVSKSKSKYLTEPNGLNAALFGLDKALAHRRVVIAEGEKKAMSLWLAGYPAVSPTNGANGFYSYPQWRVFFLDKECTIIFDPDAEGQEQAKFTASLLGGNNVVLPDKVDDLLNAGFNIREILGEPWLGGD